MPAPTTPQVSPTVLHARARLRIVNRLVFGAGIVGLAMLTQSGWWVLGALIFFTISAGAMVASFVFMAGAKARPFEYVFRSILLLITLYFMLAATGQLIFMNQVSEYAQCLESAVTISRHNQCVNDFQQTMVVPGF